MKKRLGVVRFPGTNCDADVWAAVEAVGLKPEWLWHEDRFDEKSCEAIILPGGFSYGDYLRCGALAAKSPVMQSVRQAADNGVPVLGICNGFQILCESGLLPGVLVRNKHRRFIDDWVELELVQGCAAFGPSQPGTYIRLPVAHGEGCYQIGAEGLKQIEGNGQIWWRYTRDINGSLQQIAGVMNAKKNVAGLMPHPERAMHEWMGSVQGRDFFTNLLKQWA